MKIVKNDYKLFTCLDDIIPVPDNVDLSSLLTTNCSNDFKILVDGILDNNYLDFLYQYVSKSKTKKLSTLVEMFLENSPLTLYNDYYSISSDRVPSLFHIIETRFFKKWTKQLATTAFEYNAIKPYDMVLNEDKTDSLTSNSTDNSSVVDEGSVTNEEHITNDTNNSGVFGFNSNTSVPTDTNEHFQDSNNEGSSSNTSTRNNTSTYSRENPLTRLITRSGNIGNTPQQDLILKERSVWEYQMWDILFKDLDSVLTRPKYI